MKLLRAILCIAILVFQIAPTAARLLRGSASTVVTARSQLVLRPLGQTPAAEYPLLNLMKEAANWTYGIGGTALLPTDLSYNGYPSDGAAANWQASGAATLVNTPSQATRPGNYTLTWTGGAKFSLGFNGGGVNRLVSCTGTGAQPGNAATCDNTACSTFTGYIVTTTLTVTVAPTGTGCTLAAGVPISWATTTTASASWTTSSTSLTVASCVGITPDGKVKDSTTSSLIGYVSTCVGTTLTLKGPAYAAGSNGDSLALSDLGLSKFGTTTIITTAGSVCGGNTCYTLNQSQTYASSGAPATLIMGGRFETNVTTPFPTTTTDRWQVKLGPANTGTTAPANFALVFTTGGAGTGDETLYWNSATPCGKGQACLAGSLFTTRVKQGNFAVFRNLDWIAANISNCTTWSSRKTTNYATYHGIELRDAPLGNDASGYINPSQYVNAAGTGLSGGTVSYNGGTDTYSITLSSGGPVDKQSILMLPPTTGTINSLISLNGSTGIPKADGAGNPNNNMIPSTTRTVMLTYDAALNVWIENGATTGAGGLDCQVPPEIFIEICAEFNVTPWFVELYLALDPMTDWVKKEAAYVKAAYPTSGVFGKPIFEIQNETFNTATANPCYTSNKSNVWIAADPTAWHSGSLFCGGSGNISGEIGKMANTAGQDLNTVLGFGNYEMLLPVQTYGGTNQNNYSDSLQSPGYLNQTLIAVQSGYNNTNPTYKYATRISVNDYWNNGYYHATANNNASQVFTGFEVAISYCYYFYSTSSTCQGLYVSQAAAMTAMFASNSVSGSGASSFNAANFIIQMQRWNTWASLCSAASVRFSGCTINAVPLMMYEGGYNESSIGADIFHAIKSATNVSQAVIETANPSGLAAVQNGCVVGQTVTLSALSGGTWSTAAGSYTVQAVPDSTHCTINLNSTGLGTFSGGTVTYTGSQTYINFQLAASYLAPDLDTWTTTVYSSALSNGGVNPSQYWMAAQGPWFVFSYDLYGYYQMGGCTACTVSTNQLTLGGTISGQFRVGDTVFGSTVAGVGTGAGSNTTISACTPIGSNVCGTTAGDILTLSQSSTVAGSQTLSSNATPGAPGSGLVSPVRSFHAICAWNSNGGAC